MDHKRVIQTLNTYRKKHDIFKKSISSRPVSMQVVTFDGPPFASGTPHYGHALVSIMKDTLGRFKTMQGYRVERIRGWDCHGLPVEKYVEKQLGIDGKKDIEEKLGIEKFVEACRDTVRNVNGEWKTFVDQIGRWADMDNAYFTMDLEYMESVMWVFSKLYDKNLVYKGFSVQGYCPSCATALSNSEVNDGYQDRQDPTITVKFPVRQTQTSTYMTTEDACIYYVQAVIQNPDGQILSLYSKKYNNRQFPGGKVEQGENPEDALIREIQEELGVQATITKHIGKQKKIIGKDMCYLLFYAATIDQQPTLQEKDKHAYRDYITITTAENTLGYGYKAKGLHINDEDEVKKFHDLYSYQQILQYGSMEGHIHLLAWTTTPWTLPSNMFLAVGKDIVYSTVYDKTNKEYYILAKDLLTSYYKSPEEYITIDTNKGEDIVGISYQPLRDFYAQSKDIADQYKSQTHTVLAGDFVTTESGTGIVHIAPAFGQDDFDLVKSIFPKDDASNRLFLPVDDYAEFTDAVANRQGVRCYDANKDIIQDLKKDNKIVSQNTINHSYPHCRRCETPLIYKAMTSRFIKEQSIAQNTIPSLEDIGFTPEGIKNRFRDVLKSAPDWNVSRNRYRGAPIPIRQSQEDPEKRIVIKNLDELYQYTKTGSANITQNIYIATAESQKTSDDLSKKGLTQSQTVQKNLQKIIKSNEDIHIIIAPEASAYQTIYPYIQENYNDDAIKEIQTKYRAIQKNYETLKQTNKLDDYLADSKTTKYFSLHDTISIDFRIHSIQNQKNIQQALEENNDRHKTKSVITICHSDVVYTMRYLCRQFNTQTQKEKYYPTPGSIHIHYRDNQRKTEIDLHKPYIDAYRFVHKKHTYKRIPEVLDCWFESGAMPYGQVNYKGEKGTMLHYPADYIIEGLDQTRGRFRTLHVLGQGMMNKNAFHNVIINGLILAEDGKKMSKKLKNYPEPTYLLEKYGPDALRMYLLTSPAVRSEPVRLGESMVEQMYKDFSAPLLNAYNFFATYAKIDGFQAHPRDIYYSNTEIALDQTSITTILRANIDTIITLDTTTNTATQIQTLIQSLQNKKTDIVQINTNDPDRYQQTIQQYAHGNILLIGDNTQYKTLRKQLYGKDNANASNGFVPLPSYAISNDLDRRILADRHNTVHEIENNINEYILDTASKEIVLFIEKLTNRYIRRSRRRFWATGMDADKTSAYNTLFSILKQLLHTAAPFAPFITEHIRQQLQTFTKQTNKKQTIEQSNSIHLNYLPISSPQYIDEQLIKEIALVRRIISLGLFVRSKNNIKIKQPLASIHIRIE